MTCATEAACSSSWCTGIDLDFFNCDMTTCSSWLRSAAQFYSEVRQMGLGPPIWCSVIHSHCWLPGSGATA